MRSIGKCTCFGGVVAMNGENGLLVTVLQMTWLSLRNNRLKLKTSGKIIADRFRGVCRICLNLTEKNR